MTRLRSLELIMQYATALCVVEDLGGSNDYYSAAYAKLKQAVDRHNKRFKEWGKPTAERREVLERLCYECHGEHERIGRGGKRRAIALKRRTK